MRLLTMTLLAAGCLGGTGDHDTGSGAEDDSGAARDDDRDGYVAAEDCDEDDRTTHPGADEWCNGEDDDCDGVVDDVPVNRSWWPDADGDGWGDASASPVARCEGGPGETLRGDDCDDADPATNPAATDSPDDGIDQDCDGWETSSDCAAARPVTGDLWVAGPGSAPEIAAFCASGAVALDGDVEIAFTELTDLAELDCLCSVTGTLSIHDNAALTTLTGLESLTSVKRLELERNALVTLIPLAGTTVEDSVRVYEEGALTSLDGLRVDSRLENGLSIQGCDALASLDGIVGLDEVVTGVFLQDNDALASIAGFGSLTSVSSLGLRRNPALRSLEGLEGLTRAGYLMLEGNGIERLSGLENLGYASYLQIEGNAALVDVTALSAVTSISRLSIVDNDTLVSLAGFESLRTVGGSFLLTGNAALADISPLAGLESVGGDLDISGNPSLAGADAWAVVDAIDTIGGTISVYGNGP